MTDTKKSLSTKFSTKDQGWTSTQAYGLAVLCLVLGVGLGYLFRGSAPVSAQAATSTQPKENPHAQGGDMQAATANATEPLLEALTRDPNDYDALVKLANAFYDGQQFQNAVPYYERALAIHPENPDVRTDMGTAYWYMGNADKAIEAMETSLKYRPGHPQTLFNLGWVRWQGKSNPKGAVQAWEQLLKVNPDYPQKQQVEQYIAKAKEHAARG